MATMEYLVQLGPAVLDPEFGSLYWTSSTASVSFNLQIALLSISLLATISFIFGASRKRVHDTGLCSAYPHAVFNASKTLGAMVCAILSTLAYSSKTWPEDILSMSIILLWFVIAAGGVLAFLLPWHHHLLRSTADLLALSIFFSTTVPNDLFPHIFFQYNTPYQDHTSICHLGFVITTAVILPIMSPYCSHLPRDAQVPHPRALTSPITRWWTYSWVTSFITKAYSRRSNLTMEDLPPLTPHSHPALWIERFVSLRLQCSNTLQALVRLFCPRMATMAFFMICCGLSEFLGALGLRNLLLHLESQPSKPLFTPWFSALLFGASPVIRGIFMQTFEFFSTEAICHLKGTVISMSYRKIFSSRPGAPPDAGQTINLISADIDKIATFRYYIMAAFMVPVEVIVASLLLYQTLGWACLPGIGILLFTRAPIAWYFSSLLGTAQQRVMTAIDSRVRRVGDTVRGLQTIKMLGHGASFVAWIDEKRSPELCALWQKWKIVALSDGVSNLFVFIPLVVSLTMYTLVKKKPLEPSVVFTVLSVFNTLQKMLGLTVIGANCYAQAMVSLNRLSNFLDANSDDTTSQDATSTSITASEPEGIFGCKDAVILAQSPEGKEIEVLAISDLEFIRGGLNLVIGKTGSGKSTLIKALISELRLSSGIANLRSHPSETLAYAPQNPWLQRGTIRDNILLSSPFCQARYDEVLRVTALDLDLATIAGGDLSDVGEAGSSLSGGQKSRIGLARAIYSSNKIVVLDDVLAALDANTSAFVFENALCGPLLKNRTVIMVSQSDLCRAMADQIIELDHGSVKSIQRQKRNAAATNESKSPEVTISEYEVLSSSSMTVLELAPTSSSTSLAADIEARQNGDQNTKLKSEAILTGLIGRLTFLRYLGLYGSRPILILLCAVLLTAQWLDVASSFWLTIWSSNSSTFVKSASFYVSIYAGIGLGWIITSTSGTLLLFFGAIKAGKVLHSRMLASVLGSTFGFVTNTPAGQIMNRFSSDMFSLDNTLPELIKQVLENYLSIVLRIAAVSSVLPVFLVPASLFLGMGVITGHLYMYGSTASKRLYAAGLSPILSSVTEAISGIEVIRPYGVQEDFRSRFDEALEIYLRGWEAISATQRWLAVRMDLFAGMISLSAAILSMVLANDNPATVGFSMTSSSALCTALLYAVYLSSVLEVEMNSFQRAREYITGIPQEEVMDSKVQPPRPCWPEQGRLQVSNLTAGYCLDGEPVIEGISFSAEPGKRIAIVGRSGGGKSTLVASILRLAVKYRGSIVIDGMDVEDVDVVKLRQAVSFIPQDPKLFEDTLRFNLDFTRTVADEDLEEILTQVVGGSGVHKAWSLDQPIAMNGGNLSQGERQLVAMARALANDARIVIIDEATASLDPESDQRIQHLLRERFPHKTLIAIAHRLDTILDFDEVLVMETGQLVERGNPKTLINSGEGHFWKMWVAQETGRGKQR